MSVILLGEASGVVTTLHVQGVGSVNNSMHAGGGGIVVRGDFNTTHAHFCVISNGRGEVYVLGENSFMPNVHCQKQ